MDREFSFEYSKRSDAELLQLASDRTSLTAQADAALTEELRRRNLKEPDKARHQQSVRRNEQLNSKRKRRKILGRWTDGGAWIYVLQVLLLIVVLSTAYSELPRRFQLKSNWEAAAWHVMWASACIAVFGLRQRTVSFWVSLVISSFVHLVVVHAWLQRAGTLSLIQGKQATALGFVSFGVLYFAFWILSLKLFREESRGSR